MISLCDSNSRRSPRRFTIPLLAIVALLPVVLFLACAENETVRQTVNTGETARDAGLDDTPPSPPLDESDESDDGLPPIASSHRSPGGAFGSMPPRANAGWSLLDGRHTTLDDLRGNVVVLDFYATWCAPCRDEVPHLVSLERRFNKQGLRVVGLNVGGEDDLAEIPAFVNEFKIPYQLGTPDIPLVYELMGEGQSPIPQTFVFDRQGKLLRHFVGYNEDIGTELEQTVQAALREN